MPRNYNITEYWELNSTVEGKYTTLKTYRGKGKLSKHHVQFSSNDDVESGLQELTRQLLGGR